MGYAHRWWLNDDLNRAINEAQVLVTESLPRAFEAWTKTLKDEIAASDADIATQRASDTAWNEASTELQGLGDDQARDAFAGQHQLTRLGDYKPTKKRDSYKASLAREIQPGTAENSSREGDVRDE